MPRVLLALPLVLLALCPIPAAALTLAEAMELAARNTEAATLLELDVAAAQADEREALGALLPLLRATHSSIRNEEEIRVGDQTFVNLWDHTANLRVSLDLFRGTSIPAWIATQEATEATALRSRWERAGLRLAVARAYLAALTARNNLAAAQESTVLRQTSLEQTEVLRGAGYGFGADLSRARFSLIEAESAVVDAQQGLEDALDTLAFLVDVPELHASDLIVPDLPSDPAPDTTLAARADLRALERDIAVRSALTTGQWLSFLPVLSMAGQYNVGPESLRAPDGTYWFISLTATWDLFDYSRYGRLDGAEVAERAAGVRLDEAARQLETELERARRRVGAAEQRLTLSEAAVAAAVETRDLEADRYGAGDSTALDLVTADVDLFRAQVASNLAHLERDLSRVELAYLTGQLEDDEWMRQ